MTTPTRPTGKQPTGSVAPTTQATIPPNPGSQYVEFFLTAVWTWTEAGRIRLRKFMESLNVDRPTYSFDLELQAVKVRCPRDSEVYIRRNFFQFVQEIENEYRQLLQTADAVQTDGTLTDPVQHPDVRLPVFLPNTRRLLVDQATKSDTSGSVGGHASQTGGPTMSLIVPDELRESLHIVAWQDLQARNKNFERTYFFSPAAKSAIESAGDVRIVVDAAQKVIFIGSSASLDAAREAQARLTRLLQNHQFSLKRPSISHHVFYVESPTAWTIDTREISRINPVLAPSTILDPWKYQVPEQYDLFHDDAGVFALRVCLEEPLRNGQRNKTWSLFGPRARNVFNGRRPQRSSRYFDGLRAARRPRAIKQNPLDDGVVGNWLQDLNKVPATVDEATLSTPVMGVGAQTPTYGIGEDDPIPLNFDPSQRPDATNQASERFAFPRGSGKATAKLQPTSLLDQQDAVLRDPSSTLQRAMKPSQRVITVPDPDVAELEPPSQRKPPVQALVGLPSPGSIGVINAHVPNKEELGIFKTSICRLMERMRGRHGVISLRAELGRYYACKVPQSGRAVNRPNDPAWGWNPAHLREKMEQHPHFIFTNALTSWGNDVDFLGGLMWEPKSRAIFFDFRFQATLSNTPMDMVLEVNASDYTWTLRCLDNIDDVVYVHCLAQHWDFQVPLTYDRPLEYQSHWAKFAEALIESLDVRPPEIEFQHTFSEAPVASDGSSIIIQDVRVRQVCRLQHQNKKTYLDINRILPTKVIPTHDPKYRKVRSVLAKTSVDNPSAGDNPVTGEFAQWFEASISSVRLEELLQQNQVLVPGDEADWSIQQIEQEQLLTHLYQQAAEVVQKMNGIGVECNNGHELRQPKASSQAYYEW